MPAGIGGAPTCAATTEAISRQLAEKPKKYPMFILVRIQPSVSSVDFRSAYVLGVSVSVAFLVARQGGTDLS